MATTVQHRQFDKGMNQDEAPFLLEEGFVYSSKNFIYDRIGTARKRGGLTGIGSTGTKQGDHICPLVMDDGSVVWYMNSIRSAPFAGFLVSVDPTTGTETVISLAAVNVGSYDASFNTGRSFQHHGFLMIPNMSLTVVATSALAVAGATGSVAERAFTTPATCVVTAGDSRIPTAVADSPTTLMQVGQIITIVNAARQYVGRVTKLISTTAFEVYPTPAVAMTAPTSVQTRNVSSQNIAGVTASSAAYLTGRVGMSFQGRVVWGNTYRDDANAAARLEYFPRRVHFSSLLLEQDATGKALPLGGAVFLGCNGYPDYNWFDLPGSDPVSAMAPTGFGDAVIFSPFRAYRLTGNLSTQYGTTQSVTWANREIPNSVGCMSERSLQRTPRGLIFAHDSGVYSTDGSSMQPLMFRTISNYWRNLVRGANFKIYGSALIRGNHYYICGTSAGTLWGLMVNLDTLAWGPITGKSSAPASFAINSSAQNPIDPSSCLGLKWWDQTAAAPSMTGGQIVKLSDMFNPSVANRSDSDNQLVDFELITRAYSEDSPGMQKNWLAATIEYAQTTGSDVTVTPALLIDSARVPVTSAAAPIFYLPEQDVYSVTAAAGAIGQPIVLTIGAHDVKVDCWVFVQGVLGTLAANGPWRVQAVTATTITLMGSAKDAAYTSGGTVQAVDQRDIPLNTAIIGTGSDSSAIVYRISDTDSSPFGGTGGASEFELQGIAHTWEDRGPHVE